MAYYLPNNMVIKEMVSQNSAPGGRDLKDMLDALWEKHPRMSIDARRIQECHVYLRSMLEVYFLLDDTCYYETTSSSLTPSASAIG